MTEAACVFKWNSMSCRSVFSFLWLAIPLDNRTQHLVAITMLMRLSTRTPTFHNPLSIMQMNLSCTYTVVAAYSHIYLDWWHKVFFNRIHLCVGLVFHLRHFSVLQDLSRNHSNHKEVLCLKGISFAWLVPCYLLSRLGYLALRFALTVCERLCSSLRTSSACFHQDSDTQDPRSQQWSNMLV